MSPLKRKRIHEAAHESPPSKQGQPTVSRRATHQTAIAPLSYQADPEPRRHLRTRAVSTAIDEPPEGHDDEEPPSLLKRTGLRQRGGHMVDPPAPGRGRGRGRASAPQRRPVLRSAIQTDPTLDCLKPDVRNRTLRHHQRYDGVGHNDPRHGDTNGFVAPMPAEASTSLRPVGSFVGPVVGGSQPPSKPVQKYSLPRTTTITTVPIMTQGQPRPVKILDHITANTSKPFVPVTNNSTPQPAKPARKQQTVKQNQSHEQKKTSSADRNIDKVVFGNVCFSTWYHSPYGTEALGGISGNSVKATSANGPQDATSKEESILNATSKKAKEDKLDRLYVCPCCFKYSKELVPWWQHVHLCERRGYVPGEKIYTHPKGRQNRQVPDGSAAAHKGQGRKRKHSDVPANPVEDPAEDQGEWSIWEVDGEREGLFCQNLSLFAKLFLDNKSVFFDVNGFNYFLLVHTVPRSPSDGGDGEILPPKQQIVGFFSKEKLSWDNNNLACILIFPPWQRKGLGALLMGVSYEISKRQGMLGGPEKPISDLGKKGYKRFWAGEIAGWILGLTASGHDELVVDADDCSKATWIVPEDCIMILREMGVIDEAGMGLPKPKRREVVSPPGDGEDTGEPISVVSGDKDEEVKEVPRVRISKEAVWKWVQMNNISLEKACDPNGFVEGYAIKETVIVGEEEM